LNKDAIPCFNLNSITHYPEFSETELQNEDSSKFKVYHRKRSAPLYVPIVPIKVKICESRVDNRIASEFNLLDDRSGVPEMVNESIGKLSCRFLVAIAFNASYLFHIPVPFPYSTQNPNEKNNTETLSPGSVVVLENRQIFPNDPLLAQPGKNSCGFLVTITLNASYLFYCIVSFAYLSSNPGLNKITTERVSESELVHENSHSFSNEFESNNHDNQLPEMSCKSPGKISCWFLVALTIYA
jgi:hypothetical protein